MLETENVSPDEESTTDDETPSARDESRLKPSPGSKQDEKPQNPTNTSPKSPTERSPEEIQQKKERGRALEKALLGSLNKVRKGNYYETADLQEFLEMSDEEFKEFSSRKESLLKPSNESSPDTSTSKEDTIPGPTQDEKPKTPTQTSPKLRTPLSPADLRRLEERDEAYRQAISGSLNKLRKGNEKEIVDVKESLGMPEKESTQDDKPFSISPTSTPNWRDASMERLRRNAKLSHEELVSKKEKFNDALENLFQKKEPDKPKPRGVLVAEKRPVDPEYVNLTADALTDYVDDGVTEFTEAVDQFANDFPDHWQALYWQDLYRYLETGWRILKETHPNISDTIPLDEYLATISKETH